MEGTFESDSRSKDICVACMSQVLAYTNMQSSYVTHQELLTISDGDR